jgi:hypothetical protein
VSKVEAPTVGATIEPDRLYTYDEIGAMCGTSPRRVRRWVEEGKLAYTSLPGGRGRRIAGWQWIEHLRSSAVTADAR